MVNDLKKRKITDSSFDDKSKSSFNEWHGVKSYAEALELLAGGYQPTVDKLKTEIKPNATGTKKRITFHNDICGFTPIVPNALMGIPQSMINTRTKAIKCKVVDIYYNIGVSAMYDSDEIIKAGQLVLGTIMKLEQEGYKFNIYAMQAYNDSKSSDMCVVKVKSSNQPLDLKRISFPLTHTAFFRVIGFDWYSRFPLGKYRVGLGKPLNVVINKEDTESLICGIFGQNSIYMNAQDIINKNYNEEYVKEEVLKHEKR